MVHDVAELIDRRAPLLAGVGRGIGYALALARASRAAGAGALMAHQPPDPFVAPRGVVAYVLRVADAAQGLPVVLYLRNDGNGLDAIEQLCRVPGIAGVKWASPTPLRLGRRPGGDLGSAALRRRWRFGFKMKPEWVRRDGSPISGRRSARGLL
jgi:4-hydroxy-tetrahydrodipicolinate synthase